MYQPIETTAARTIWIDSPTEERLGFQDSSRVQIDRDPTGVTDWKEPGDAFRATLMGGMWPDDDELRLLVVGVVPHSAQAEHYLLMGGQRHIAGETLTSRNACVPGTDSTQERGMERLRDAVQIMPAWAGQKERSIFVRQGTPRAEPSTVLTEATGITAPKQAQRTLTFDMWRIQVDGLLIGRGEQATDNILPTGIQHMEDCHDNGLTPVEWVDAYIKGPDNGRNETQGQAAPA